MEISNASLPVSADLSNGFKSIILDTDQGKFYPSWGYFGRKAKIFTILNI